MSTGQNIPGAGVASAMAMKQAQAQIRNLDAQTALTNSKVNPVAWLRELWADLPEETRNNPIMKKLYEQFIGSTAKNVKDDNKHNPTYENPANSNTKDIQTHRNNSRRHELGKHSNSER